MHRSNAILVVEDEPNFAHILYDLAHELGYQCLVAHGADEGYDLAKEFVPDAILLDMRLPRWQDSNRLRGHGYFDFEEAAGMQAAIAKLNRHVFGSRYLTVVQATSAQRGSAARKVARFLPQKSIS